MKNTMPKIKKANPTITPIKEAMRLGLTWIF